MNKTKLQELGLSEGESEIYLALLKTGSSNVTTLSKKTGRHRTHIYDTIEKLKDKGLVSESMTNNKKTFHASDPENILDFLKEKEDSAKSLVKEMKNLIRIEASDIKVETFKGKAGLKSVLRDILREGKDYVGYGEGTHFEKLFPIFFHQFRAQEEKLGMNLKLILKKKVKVPKRKGLQIRYLDYVSPSATFIMEIK